MLIPKPKKYRITIDTTIRTILTIHDYTKELGIAQALAVIENKESDELIRDSDESYDEVIDIEELDE